MTRRYRVKMDHQVVQDFEADREGAALFFDVIATLDNIGGLHPTKVFSLESYEVDQIVELVERDHVTVLRIEA